MSAHDEPGLIKPQSHATDVQHAPTKEELAAEKQKRIDDALEHYASAQQPAGTIIAASKGGEGEAARPQPEEAVLTTELHKAHERAPVQKLKKLPRHERNQPATTVFTPTEADPDATIAAAVEEARQREMAAQAAEAEELSKAANRYSEANAARKVQNPFRVILRSKKLSMYAAVWLCAVPLAFGLYGLEEHVSSNAMATGLMVLVYIIGAYGMLGWIPLMVFYMREDKDWW